jgi:ATP-dependent phosphoenolpyruvate carboxykinase
VFNLDVPTAARRAGRGARSRATTWPTAPYDEQAAKLARMFVENFKTFEQGVDAEVLAAGPEWCH